MKYKFIIYFKFHIIIFFIIISLIFPALFKFFKFFLILLVFLFYNIYRIIYNLRIYNKSRIL
jgi:hypothetical protein